MRKGSNSGLPGSPGKVGNPPAAQRVHTGSLYFFAALGVIWGLRGVNVGVLILGDAAQLCLPPDSPTDTRMAIVPGIENCGKILLGSSLGRRVGLPDTALTARAIFS